MVRHKWVVSECLLAKSKHTNQVSDFFHEYFIFMLLVSGVSQ